MAQQGREDGFCGYARQLKGGGGGVCSVGIGVNAMQKQFQLSN